MVDRLRQFLLRFLRVPPEPQPPIGAPGSIMVFRAGRNYFKLRLLRWGVTQVGAVFGIIFSLYFFGQVEAKFEAAAAAAAQPAPVAKPPAAASAPADATPGPAAAAAEPAPERPRSKQARRDRVRDERARQFIERWGPWIFPGLRLLEYGAIALFILQIPVTLAATRLEFEQHWYIVTDRSLRIRNGIFQLTESTMSFANLQQVEVKQGPLQRLLGLADVRVQSAGGGGVQDEKHAGDSLHTGIFHSVENANEIRDLILTRLRQFRQAGLGDPDDHPQAEAALEPGDDHTDTLAAARELLAEARALRAVVTAGPGRAGL
ncbi:MAG: PH domain-containing protein [Opitutaceae bacterium]|nr:PH domain-containing protein [Opitutaceae bacterium]